MLAGMARMRQNGRWLVLGQKFRMNYILVFIGGGVGSSLRHSINLASARGLGTAFPYHTFIINITGSMVMGLIAGYLAHPQFYGPGGHGVKGAVLNSGFYDNGETGSNYFGKDPKELAERSSVEGMKKLNIPLLISHTEVDLPDAIVQADNVKKALCDAGRCPVYLVLKDHSHVSQNYAIGTADVSLSGPVLQLLKKIK
jgi:hypothetical protein